MKSYPYWFYALLLFSLSVLILSGFFLIPTALSMRLEWDVFWRLGGDARLLSVSSHTMSSYLILGLIGALYPIHMRTGLRTKKGFRSGFSLVGVFFILMLSGLALFYLGSLELLTMASIVHMICGLVLVLIFTLHYVRSRLSKR